jgi:two-component system, OmpR family, sensor kinase
MSLRARLALLYTSIVGGILFLFGMVVYISVSITLTNHIDDTLAWAATQIINSARVGSVGVTLPEIDLSTDIYIQMWGINGQLESASPNIEGFNFPLDIESLRENKPVYRDNSIGNAKLRVLTVPLVIRHNNRPIGLLQLATSVDMVQTTQDILLWVLFIGAGISMVIAGLGGWFSTTQALSPLEGLTQTALLITRADDLSRRIPYYGQPNDEVGQLISAFNQTLSRLENLFNSQRRFLADVGHELRTPLTVIKGNVDLMRRIGCSDTESIQSIDSEVDRLSRLVGDLLLLAQAESGKIPLAQELVEMDSLLLDILSQMQILAKGRVNLSLGDFDQVQVCGDRDRLKQVMVNLIGNAIKYTPKGGKVIVGLGKIDEMTRITVSDNGPGIPQEDLPFIFERFYRAEKSRTRRGDGKGFGLGLSIAYWIVRNHGGQIEVSSTAAKGATFCVILPLATNNCPGKEKMT